MKPDQWTRRASQLVTAGFLGLMAFQLALAAGAPWGEAAWGGRDAELTKAQRVASGGTVAFYLLALAIVRGRADGRTGRLYRWGTWALAIVLGLSAILNLASRSPWERYLFAPLALCAVGLLRRRGVPAAVARPRFRGIARLRARR